MSIRNLDALFAPGSVAVIGASVRSGSVGEAVMRNLLRAGFNGPIMPVNPKYDSVCGVLAYKTIEALPRSPDLAVICTPAAVVPKIIGELAQYGTRAAIVLSAGLDEPTQEGRTLKQDMLDAARPHLLRILGPNCLGLLVPKLSLNASFAHIDALPGSVALVHQSGALCTALLDWAYSNRIGFSHFVSLGDSADIDFGDVLDYLGGEADAKAILLYVESIKQARKFMSAARAAARNKPVVVVKAGRVEEGARAAASHTGAITGSDDVYDAAFQRAGMLRVFDSSEMFDAVETLSRGIKPHGERLAILTNGGGPGVLATDALILNHGSLATLSDQTIARLDAILPPTWSGANPIDIIGDADGKRYADALKVLSEDDGVDAVLVLHAPTAVVSSTGAAEGVIEIHQSSSSRQMILASWLGGDTVQPARRLLSQAGIPNYETPDGAVRAFMHLVKYRRNHEILMQTPPSVPDEFEPVTSTARLVIEAALAEGRSMLTEPEAKAVLSAYGIPIVETRIASDPDDAADVAQNLGFPVAVKILSEDISHKSDVGGVVLDLESKQDVLDAARAMLERIQSLKPGASISGFTVQRMARRPGAHELIIGATTDAIFGPVMVFGQGGTAVEIIADRAVALPPLNLKLAREMMRRTRVFRLLKGYRDRAAADTDAIERVLIKVSQLITDIAQISSIDINPLLADDQDVLALDARIEVSKNHTHGPARLAIRPYPKELEETIELDGSEILLRPIRPEDEPAHKVFLESLNPKDIRFRFFGAVRRFPHSQLARFTQIDYDREMAFIAEDENADNNQTVGVVRAVADPDNIKAEFAIVVASDIKGKGLGLAMLEKMIRYCRSRGIGILVGEVLADNKPMLGLARHLGFELNNAAEAGVMTVSLEL